MSRMKFALRNSIVVILAQCIIIMLGFIVRKRFIISLGISYLGYNSVFNNILSFLNLTELGVGVAITSFLYKPLLHNEQEDIKVLMFIYKRIYRIIACVVLVIGLLIIPVLPILIPDASINYTYLMFLYIINVLGVVATYLLSYKRSLLIADQKNYIITMYDLICNIGCSIAQLWCLLTGKSYESYLLLNISKTILSNSLIVLKTNRAYPYLNKNINCDLYEQYFVKIKKYIKDIFISKLGGFIFNSSDNLIISTFKGSVMTGYLSNYTMITLQLQTIISQILSSLQSTFGNYVHEIKNIKKIESMFRNYMFINYNLGNICMMSFVFLVQPFIAVYFSKDLQLEDGVAILLGINLLFFVMLQILSQMFVIFQLYKYDKWIVVVSAITNLVLSIILVVPFGICGVLIGTLITSLIYLFSRLYILYKKIFDMSVLYYLKKLLKFGICSCFEFLLLLKLLSINQILTIPMLFVRGGIIVFIVSGCSFLFFHKDEEYQYFIFKLKGIVISIINKVSSRRKRHARK